MLYSFRKGCAKGDEERLKWCNYLFSMCLFFKRCRCDRGGEMPQMVFHCSMEHRIFSGLEQKKGVDPKAHPPVCTPSGDVMGTLGMGLPH